MKEYRDEQDKYAFSVPSDWVQAEGVTDNPQSTRRVVAFYPPDQPEINVSVVATSLGADYPKMGSFGSPDEFATAPPRRPGRPREGPKQFSYVVDAKALDAKYALEYTVERPTENFYQHLYSVVGIGRHRGSTGRYAHRGVPGGQVRRRHDALKKIAATPRRRRRCTRDRRATRRLLRFTCLVMRGETGDGPRDGPRQRTTATEGNRRPTVAG